VGNKRWKRNYVLRDKLVDNESLKQKFSRLFSVFVDVGGTLSHVGVLNDNG